MTYVILAIQSALLGLVGQGSFDAAGCPLPNSTQFDVSGWSVNISLPEHKGEFDKDYCPVTISMSHEGCFLKTHLKKLESEILYPGSANHAMKLLVDGHNIPWPETRSLNNFSRKMPILKDKAKICGDSVRVSINMAIKADELRGYIISENRNETGRKLLQFDDGGDGYGGGSEGDSYGGSGGHDDSYGSSGHGSSGGYGYDGSFGGSSGRGGSGGYGYDGSFGGSSGHGSSGGYGYDGSFGGSSGRGSSGGYGYDSSFGSSRRGSTGGYGYDSNSGTNRGYSSNRGSSSYYRAPSYYSSSSYYSSNTVVNYNSGFYSFPHYSWPSYYSSYSSRFGFYPNYYPLIIPLYRSGQEKAAVNHWLLFPLLALLFN